jgi:hypothetical protein
MDEAPRGESRSLHPRDWMRSIARDARSEAPSAAESGAQIVVNKGVGVHVTVAIQAGAGESQQTVADIHSHEGAARRVELDTPSDIEREQRFTRREAPKRPSKRLRG